MGTPRVTFPLPAHPLSLPPQERFDQGITGRLPFAGPCPGSSVVAQDQHLWMAGCSFPLQTRQPSVCPMKAPARSFTPARSALLPGTARLAGPGNRHGILLQSQSKLRTEELKGSRLGEYAEARKARRWAAVSNSNRQLACKSPDPELRYFGSKFCTTDAWGTHHVDPGLEPT